VAVEDSATKLRLDLAQIAGILDLDPSFTAGTLVEQGLVATNDLLVTVNAEALVDLGVKMSFSKDVAPATTLDKDDTSVDFDIGATLGTNAGGDSIQIGAVTLKTLGAAGSLGGTSGGTSGSAKFAVTLTGDLAADPT